MEAMGTVRETLLDAWSGRLRSQRWQSPKSYQLASRPQMEHPQGFERCLPGLGSEVGSDRASGLWWAIFAETDAAET
ncbi:MAG: hypothetical protein ACI8TP_005075 [Acidimicrobiales bacterium]